MNLATSIYNLGIIISKVNLFFSPGTSSDCTPAIVALAIVCALIFLLFVAAIALLIFAWIKITGKLYIH